MFKEFLRRVWRRVPTLPPRAAYELWAQTYTQQRDNVFLQTEEQALLPLLDAIPLAGKTILDVGCGTGRHIHHCLNRQARKIVGVDFSRTMLHHVVMPEDGADLSLVEGSLAALPLRQASFDLALVALVLGHFPDLAPAVAELARVVRPGGRVLISDWHPENERRGWRRVFEVPSESGRSRRFAVEHHFHSMEDYIRSFQSGGFVLEKRLEPVIDESMKSIFEKASMAKVFQEYRGSPLVLVLGFRKP